MTRDKEIELRSILNTEMFTDKAIQKIDKLFPSFTESEIDYLLTLCNHNKGGVLYSPENKQVIKKLKKL